MRHSIIFNTENLKTRSCQRITVTPCFKLYSVSLTETMENGGWSDRVPFWHTTTGTAVCTSVTKFDFSRVQQFTLLAQCYGDNGVNFITNRSTDLINKNNQPEQTACAQL